jgi:immunity protein, SdpI family
MMKTNRILKELLIGCITITPLVFYLYIWNSLPTTIPIHFDAQGNPNNYGSRSYIAITILFLTVGSYFFLKYIPKIDQKKNFAIFQNTFYKLRLILALFFSIISFIIINSVKHGETSTSLLLIIISLIISVLGNYMGNIRPNYFIGIRNPWTLDDELIWKRTHYLTGRLWFTSGIAMGVFMMLLPANYIVAVFISGIMLLVIYPFAYSYGSHQKLVKTTKKLNHEK